MTNETAFKNEKLNFSEPQQTCAMIKTNYACVIASVTIVYISVNKLEKV